ncbi:MAG TPA: hypothetical protein ENK78_00715 [Thiothrix sp.]|nr:hypothetical protein [Thiothrix sp.]
MNSPQFCPHHLHNPQQTRLGGLQLNPVNSTFSQVNAVNAIDGGFGQVLNSFTLTQTVNGGRLGNFAAPFNQPLQQFGGLSALSGNGFANPQAGQFFHAVFQLINTVSQLLQSVNAISNGVSGGVDHGMNTGAAQCSPAASAAPQGFNTLFGGDPFTDFQSPFSLDLPQLKMTACPAASFANPFSVPDLGAGGNQTSQAYFQLLGWQVGCLKA